MLLRQFESVQLCDDRIQYHYRIIRVNYAKIVEESCLLIKIIFLKVNKPVLL